MRALYSAFLDKSIKIYKKCNEKFTFAANGWRGGKALTLILKYKALAVGGQEQFGDGDSLDLFFAVPDVFNRKVAGQKLRG